MHRKTQHQHHRDDASFSSSAATSPPTLHGSSASSSKRRTSTRRTSRSNLYLVAVGLLLILAVRQIRNVHVWFGGTSSTSILILLSSGGGGGGGASDGTNKLQQLTFSSTTDQRQVPQKKKKEVDKDATSPITSSSEQQQQQPTNPFGLQQIPDSLSTKKRVSSSYKMTKTATNHQQHQHHPLYRPKRQQQQQQHTQQQHFHSSSSSWMEDATLLNSVMANAPRGFENASVLPQWLRANVELHNNNHNNASSSSSFYLKWSCRGMCGGVGDRISGIIQAFYMALCTNRTFLIEWQAPQVPLSTYLQPNVIDWEERNTKNTKNDNDNKDEENEFFVGALDKPSNAYIRDPYLLPRNQNVRVQTNLWMGEQALAQQQCMQDYLQRKPQYNANAGDEPNTKQYYDFYRNAFWTLFRWSPLVVEGTQRQRETLGLNDYIHNHDISNNTYNDNHYYVAIHLRTGRGKLFPDMQRQSNNETTWPLYYNCALSLQQGIQKVCSNSSSSRSSSNAVVPIYLASDTADAKKQFLEWDAANSVPLLLRTLPDMEIYHIDKTPKMRLTDARQSQLDVWTDLKLLTESTCLVVGEGKFSRLAQWLPAPQQQRCAVDWDKCTPKMVAMALSHVICREGSADGE